MTGATAAKSLRILVADDHELVRLGIISVLRACGMDVVAEAGDGDVATELALLHRPDLVFMDVRMPRCSGLEAAREIKRVLPDTKVVMLTVSDDERDLLEAMRSGADGYVLKDIREDEFTDVLERIGRGESIVSPTMAGRLLERLTAGERTAELSAREREVARLVGGGLTNREIAAELSISASTVDFHVRHLLEKLALRNRAQVAVWVSQHLDG